VVGVVDVDIAAVAADAVEIAGAAAVVAAIVEAAVAGMAVAGGMVAAAGFDVVAAVAGLATVGSAYEPEAAVVDKVAVGAECMPVAKAGSDGQRWPLRVPFPSHIYDRGRRDTGCCLLSR
jgi:hypothetical protein